MILLKHPLRILLQPLQPTDLGLDLFARIVATTGFDLTSRGRELAQAQRAVEVLAERTTPVVLAGDFNSTPDCEVDGGHPSTADLAFNAIIETKMIHETGSDRLRLLIHVSPFARILWGEVERGELEADQVHDIC